jgi:predicted small lipoprotein YifL
MKNKIISLFVIATLTLAGCEQNLDIVNPNPK